MRSAVLILAASLLCAATPLCRGEPIRAPLGPDVGSNLVLALRWLNMSTQDLRFAKDVARPRSALSRARRVLQSPLDLSEMATGVLHWRGEPGGSGVLSLAGSLGECVAKPAAPAARPVCLPPLSVPREAASLTAAIARFVEAAGCASGLLVEAFGAIPDEDKPHAAASFLLGPLGAEDDASAGRAMRADGIGTSALARAALDADALDPEPPAEALLALCSRVRRESLLGAVLRLRGAAGELYAAAARHAEWPPKPCCIPSPMGEIWIGSRSADRYSRPALLILEPGGDDSYDGGAGAANGLTGSGIAVILDLAGDDRYAGDRLLGAGAALFGAALVVDAAGNDVYRADYMGMGAALFGAALLEDAGGADFYQTGAIGQGAGVVGAGVLCDQGGRDVYDVGICGQGFASVLGVGILRDGGGNDRYIAGGRVPDSERYADRYLSLAQGFAIGMRPFAGGGVGLLLDTEGNDTYEADVYGQGASYWYSIGLLIDGGGQDSYSAFHYVQGSGIHLSAGILLDAGGNDRYSGYGLAQGVAHDYGVGMLIDLGGDDHYFADQSAQGMALNNGLGVLIDAAGRDVYAARRSGLSQGIGDAGGHREYGSLGLLLDLGGVDAYSCGARDGARFARPNFGIVYDRTPDEKHE